LSKSRWPSGIVSGESGGPFGFFIALPDRLLAVFSGIAQRLRHKGAVNT
jgi:hypothetical protein